MPSTTKILYFFSSALASCIAVGLLGFGMSTTWSETFMDCRLENTTYKNGSATVTIALFNLILERTSCPFLGKGPEERQAFPALVEIGGAPPFLHGVCVLLVILCLVGSCGSILIALYNSASNPYETYMGPIGLYVCSSVSACLSFLLLVLFVLNVHVAGMPQELAKSFAAELGLGQVDLRTVQTSMDLGYYLVIPYLGLTLLAIGLIYLYQHAAYTHRREQQKPTEDAPKEIMMY